MRDEWPNGVKFGTGESYSLQIFGEVDRLQTFAGADMQSASYVYSEKH